jgi:hypothetical protein
MSLMASARRQVAFAAVGISLVVAVAVITAELYGEAPSSPVPGRIGGALSSSVALELILNASAGISGGAWHLAVLDGIASPMAPSVPPSFWCPSMPGPSIWNTTQIPATQPVADLGLAAFWTAVFVNDSDYLLVISATNGIVSVGGPIPMADCTGSFVAEAGTDAYLTGILADSRSVAQDGLVEANFRSFLAEHPDYIVIYNLGGWPLVGNVPYSGAAWSLQFQTCGTPAGPLVSPFASQTFNASTGQPFAHEEIAGSFGCNYPSYQLNFTGSTSTYNSTSGTHWETFQVTANSANTTNLSYELATWMFGLRLTEPNGTTMPLGSPNCPANATSIRWCIASHNGWYAVVTQVGGGVEDVWGVAAGTPQWEYANGLMYSSSPAYWLTIVSPFSVTGSGDSLSGYPLTSIVQISGATSL